MSVVEEYYFIDIPKVSANAWAGMHWAKRGKMIRNIDDKVREKLKFKINAVVNELEFRFGWKGVALDVTNCFPLVKALEDCIMYEDSPDYVKKVSVSSTGGHIANTVMILIHFK